MSDGDHGDVRDLLDVSPPPAGDVRARGRIRGIDVARALAIVGMVMVHVGPYAAEMLGLAGRVYDVSHGRASILFVVLAGVGVSLLAGDRAPARRRSAWRRLGWRAAILLPVGLLLQPLDHGVLVILQYYAVYFVVAAVALPLGDRALLVAAGMVAVLGPVVRLVLWQAEPGWFEVGPATLATPPLVIVRDLVLSGSYPVITWSAPLLLGMWLGRRDLRAPRVRAGMLGGGIAAALLGGAVSWLLAAAVGMPAPPPSWTWLTTAQAHAETPLWLLTATGIAVAVLAACLVLADRWPRTTWPLAALGQLALTVYVGHLLVLVWWPGLLERDVVGAAAASVLRFTVVVTVAATAYRAVLSRGPLEAVLRLPAVLQARATGGRPLQDPPVRVQDGGSDQERP